MGCFPNAALRNGESAAVNAAPKVRYFKAKLQHLLLKVLELAVSRPFRDPEGSWVEE